MCVWDIMQLLQFYICNFGGKVGDKINVRCGGQTGVNTFGPCARVVCGRSHDMEKKGAWLLHESKYQLSPNRKYAASIEVNTYFVCGDAKQTMATMVCHVKTFDVFFWRNIVDGVSTPLELLTPCLANKYKQNCSYAGVSKFTTSRRVQEGKCFAHGLG